MSLLSCVYRLFDARQLEKKMLNSSREKHDHSSCGGEGGAVPGIICYAIPVTRTEHRRRVNMYVTYGLKKNNDVWQETKQFNRQRGTGILAGR